MKNLQTLIKAIDCAKKEEIDGLWAILKYREIGILRKLKSMSSLLGVKYEKVFEEAPKDSSDRVLDYDTRKTIHDILIKVSQNKIK
jgi:hypothetical protein